MSFNLTFSTEKAESAFGINGVNPLQVDTQHIYHHNIPGENLHVKNKAELGKLRKNSAYLVSPTLEYPVFPLNIITIYQSWPALSLKTATISKSCLRSLKLGLCPHTTYVSIVLHAVFKGMFSVLLFAGNPATYKKVNRGEARGGSKWITTFSPTATPVFLTRCFV